MIITPTNVQNIQSIRNNSTFPSYFKISILLLILVQVPFWSWKTSGVLEQTTNWNDYGWGYRYILKNTIVGDWPIQKENMFYINHHLAFLGTPEVVVDYGSGFELHRALYGVLTKGLWFLGPILSGFMINILFWYAAALAAAFIASRLIPNSSFAIWAAGLLVGTSQGFLYSVGEVSPHVLGYAAGYLIIAFAFYKRIWKKETSWHDQLLIYLWIGILKNAYEAAWLSLPIIFSLTLYREYQLGFSTLKNIIKRTMALLGLLCAAIIPSLLFTFITSIFMQAQGILHFLFDAMKNFSIQQILKVYLQVTWEGITALGPIIVPLYFFGFLIAWRKKNTALLSLGLLSLLQLFLIGLLLIPVSGRGYVTFGVSTLVIILSALTLNTLWETKKFRFIPIILLILLFCYNNAPLLGYRLPSLGFYMGYQPWLQAGHWQEYDVVPFD